MRIKNKSTVECELQFPEGDKLDILVTLVEEHHPIPPTDPIEVILHSMKSQRLSEHDLEPYIGSQSSITDILKRQRNLSLDMIRNLHKGLGISEDILIQPYSLRDTS